MTGKPQKKLSDTAPKRMARGFVQTGGILSQQIRTVGEKRGFAQSRLLTQWAEIVGPATAAIAQPVKVGYGREGFGATLTLLTNGANAPMLQLELPRIKERVNACYGYAAISRIRLTQTAETGFGESASAFLHAPAEPVVSAEKTAEVEHSVSDVQSDTLRSALAALELNILSRAQRKTS
jgi:hypothetical protein